MKTLLKFSAVIFLVLILTSCKKELAKLKGDTCWKCHVLDVAPNGISYDYYKTICNDGDYPGNIRDDYGNDLNFTCQKQ